MSMAKKLREITNKVNNKIKSEQESANEDFLNSDLFKTILSDFEEEALCSAERGHSIVFIHNLDKYFGIRYDFGDCIQLLVYAMGKNGYEYLPGSYGGFSW